MVGSADARRDAGGCRPAWRTSNRCESHRTGPCPISWKARWRSNARSGRERRRPTAARCRSSPPTTSRSAILGSPCKVSAGQKKHSRFISGPRNSTRMIHSRRRTSPWSIPIVLIQMTIQLTRSARRRAQLRPGPRMYYDRAWAGNRFHLPRLLAALLVFIVGYGALAFAQFRGWTFVSTGIPVIVVFLLCGSHAVPCSGVSRLRSGDDGARFDRRAAAELKRAGPRGLLGSAPPPGRWSVRG